MWIMNCKNSMVLCVSFSGALLMGSSEVSIAAAPMDAAIVPQAALVEMSWSRVESAASTGITTVQVVESTTARATRDIAPASSESAGSSGAQITAATEGSNASIKISFPGPGRKPGSNSNVGETHPAAVPGELPHGVSVSVTVKSPISKSDPTSDTMPVNLDGLANAATVEGTVIYFKPRTPRLNRSARVQLLDQCRQLLNHMQGFGIKGTSLLDLKQDLEGDHVDVRVPQSVEVSERTFAQCSEIVDIAVPGAGPGSTGFYVGTSGKVGYDEHKYFDATTLASKQVKISKTPWSASAFIGANPRSLKRALVLAKMEYQESYKDADSTVACKPLNGTSTPTCVNGSVGPPSKAVKRLYSLEMRYLFGDLCESKEECAKSRPRHSYALSLKAVYDSVKKVYGLDVPLYFIQNKDSGLSGGVKAGWQSDTHALSVGVFVGASFSLQGG